MTLPRLSQYVTETIAWPPTATLSCVGEMAIRGWSDVVFEPLPPPLPPRANDTSRLLSDASGLVPVGVRSHAASVLAAKMIVPTRVKTLRAIEPPRGERVCL